MHYARVLVTTSPIALSLSGYWRKKAETARRLTRMRPFSGTPLSRLFLKVGLGSPEGAIWFVADAAESLLNSPRLNNAGAGSNLVVGFSSNAILASGDYELCAAVAIAVLMRAE